ncbi:MAG: TlpA family protein disulfide reductase [Rikenellaceae bacterium]|nr:TlpA family protein disulfide reductase [Rikenellaceae bacterium]MCL2691963.1 TlpA family protein disulfide reductase [Rikenellaceae bacterium]
MKKFILTAMLSLFTGSLVFGQMSTVSGNINVERAGREISLFLIEDGANKPISTTVIAEDGSYGFLFRPPYEGFFMVGEDNFMFPTAPVWLKPGDNARIDFVWTSDKLEINLRETENTPENIVLGRWLKLSENTRIMSLHWQGGAGGRYTYEEFFPALDLLLQERDKFRESISTPNPRFNKAMNEFIDLNTEFIATHFIFTPRRIHPSPEQMHPFISDMVVAGRFADNSVLQMPWGARSISMYVNNAMGRDRRNSTETFLLTDELRGVYFLPRITGARDYAGFLTAMETYGRYFVTPAMKRTVEETSARLYDTRPGGVAANFTYPDADGNMVSLSDFLGKVVLVDVWATWCGPCRAEFPALRELEKAMHGKDVVFLGVSVDEEKDFEKWKQMVINEQLGGVQLFASGWTQITTDYKITGIPRFMLFDKEGRIISVSAPRPSSPELKDLIERHL